MIYFDNAATGGFKPDGVVAGVYASLKNCANAGRSGHKLSIACAQRVYACRKALCEFFGGASPERVVFTKNCTEALNMAILGTLKRGDKVVTTVAEHNSVLRPLAFLQTQGVEVAYAHLTNNGEINLNEVISLCSRDTKAVIITLASNVTGVAPDIIRLRSSISPSTYIICDGAQACGHIKIDISSNGIDALAVAGHKGMMGIQGSGALIFSERFNPNPITFGGTGSESFSLSMPSFYPDKLESGTLSYPAIISLGEGVLYLKSHMYENADRIVYLTKILLNGLADIKGISLYSRPNPYGIVAFNIGDIPSETVAFRLSDEFSICVRGGLHCAPLMHKALATSGVVRVSLSAFNTERELDCFLHAIKIIAAN
jgi:selenocysteine lyase/cysteine desulfurase